MENVKIKIKRGQEQSFTILLLSRGLFNYQAFVEAVLKQQKISIFHQNLYLITYIDPETKEERIIDNEISFKMFIDSRHYIINISKSYDTPLNIKHFTFFFEMMRQKYAVKTLIDFTQEKRKERLTQLSKILNSNQKKKTIILTKPNPIEKYKNDILVTASNYHNLHQKMTQTENQMKKINDSISRFDLAKINATSINLDCNLDISVFPSNINDRTQENQHQHHIKCVSCQRDIIGLRYKCYKCNYNICAECKKFSNYSHEHNFFIPIENSEEYEKIQPEFIKNNNINDNETMFEEFAQINSQMNLPCELCYYVLLNTKINTITNVGISYDSTEKVSLKIDDIDGIDIKIKNQYHKTFTLFFIYQNALFNKYVIKGGLYLKDGRRLGKPFDVIVNVK